MIRYKSNKTRIGDGMRITRVSGGGQKLEVLTDPAAEKWGEIELAPDPVTPSPDPVTPAPVDTAPQPDPVTPAPDPVTPSPLTGAVRDLAGFDATLDHGTDCDVLVDPAGAVPTLADASAIVRQRAASGQATTVRVRAGVYREPLDMAGVDAGAVVTVAGYGTEKPVISAFEPLTGWQPCDDTDTLIPASLRGSVWRTTLPLSSLPGGDVRALFIREAGYVCIHAMLRSDVLERPDREDRTEDWLISTGPVVSGGKIIGHAHPSLIGADPAAVMAATVAFHANPNVNVRSAVQSFDPATGTVMFANTGSDYESNFNKNRFALINYAPAIQPGQFASQVNGGTVTIWHRPRLAANLVAMEYSARGRCVVMDNAKNITLRGLIVEGASSAGSAQDGQYAISLATTGDEVGITIDNVEVRHTYRAGRDYAAIYAKTVDNLRITGCTIRDAINQFGVFIHGTDPSDPCRYPLVDRVLFVGVDNSPLRIYGALAPAISRCATYLCGISAHVNIISFYEGCENPLLLHCDFRGAAGYATPQETGGFSAVGVLIPTSTTEQAGGRAIVDQDRRDPGGKYTPAGVGYIINCDMPPSPGMRSKTVSLSLGTASRPENSFEVLNCRIHGADAIARDAQKRARITTWAGNVLTGGLPIDTSDMRMTPDEVWTNTEAGDFTPLANWQGAGLPGVDVSAQIAVLKARHPNVPTDAWDTNIFGRPIDWTRPGIGLAA